MERVHATTDVSDFAQARYPKQRQRVDTRSARDEQPAPRKCTRVDTLAKARVSTRADTRTNPLARGFTIVELLVVVSIIALLVALLLPTISRARDKALTTQSLANLRGLAAANESYATDWQGRQYTATPDDVGLANGDCSQYLAQIACPPQQLIGWDTFGLWGYFIGSSGKCAQYDWPEACYNWVVYLPMQFGTTANPGGGNSFGSFRIPGIQSFCEYVNGRFYDPSLYAPKDVVPLANVSKYFSSAAQFSFDGVHYEDSSYCWSPAAMYHPQVFGRSSSNANMNGNSNANTSDFRHPNTLPAGFRSPPVSRCRYPSLKTRMIEHSWLQNRPAQLVNHNFAGNKTPWFFNHGYNSAPASLFFDGHVELVGCQRAMQAEERAGRLWSRGTPLGANGYYGGQSYDFLVKTSFHILTIDGIEGRDVLGAEG